jgi:serine protease Do
VFLAPALAQDAAEIKALRDRVAPSLVGVEFVWAYEYGRMEFVTPGVVVRDDGLIVISVAAVAPGLPDAQLVDFKVILPGGDKDDEEIDAVFQGRDERTNLAFVKPKETGREWKAIEFEDAPVEVGETVVSVGLMPKSAGYRAYVNSGLVATKLRGEVPAWLVTGGGLANIGAPVFNAAGKAVGYVNLQQNLQPFLHTSTQNPRQQVNTLAAITNPPSLFIPASEVLFSLKNPPTPEQPIALPWIGTPQLTGLEQDVAEAFGLKDTPAIEIGDVVPGGPADKAGVKVGMKIIKLNGQPLERGDEPEELPDIFARNLRRMPIGSEVTLTVMTTKDEPTQDLTVKLEQRPKRQNELPRFWAEDLAFSVRDLTFDDTYARKQSADLQGVVVAMMKREGAAAAAELEMGDIITTLNGEPVKNLEQFEPAYAALRKEKPREPIVLVVLKPDATTRTIKIEPPR